MFKKLAINARYFIAPLLIVAALFGVIAGGPWVWTGVFLLGFGIIIDTLYTKQTMGAGFDDEGETNANPTLMNVTMYLMLPVFIALQCALAYQIYNGMAGVELLCAVLSSGIFAGIGIIYGHELAHTKGFSFIIARWMMALSGSSHFCYAHVYNHHLELGCENDPATAPRGRSLYAHLPKSYFGQSKFLYTMEKQRLKRLGVPFLTWQNRWIRGYAMSLPTIALFWYAGAWTGIACMGLIWLISNFELEALNYLEHYGLIRETGSPIDYRHSWDNSTLFTSWFFIEIGRQADHHDRGETHFWELENVGCPNTGWGYFVVFFIALVPPIWHWYMRKRLAAWDEHFATDEEKAIAARINSEVGYEGTPFSGDVLQDAGNVDLGLRSAKK